MHFAQSQPIYHVFPCFYMEILQKTGALRSCLFARRNVFAGCILLCIHSLCIIKKAAPFGTAFGDIFGYSAEESISLMRFS